MAAFAPALGQSLRSRPPRNPNSQKNDSPRQLEFTAAMKDFKNMFPDMDDEVIEAVLRANNGLVDATIDQLLSMGAGGNDETKGSEDFPHLPSYDAGPIEGLPSEPPPAYSPREGELTGDLGGRPLPARPYTAWNPPLLGKLPDDFLRLTPVPKTNTSPTTSPSITTHQTDEQKHEQFLEDEKLAKFLQNEEFVRELTRNTDFMMSLEQDNKRSMALDTNSTSPTTTATINSTIIPKPVAVEGTSNPAIDGNVDMSSLGAVGGQNQHEDEEKLREKLKHMGKSTRKKLDKMARIFHRKKTTQRDLMVGGAASTANLLEEYEEDDDDELLNTMAGGRLEIMNEGESEEHRHPEPQESSTQSENPRQAKPYDPIEFYAEDNEFQFKAEK